MPRRSAAHIARVTRPSALEPPDQARERALAQVDGVGELLHAAPSSLRRCARRSSTSNSLTPEAVLAARAPSPARSDARRGARATRASLDERRHRWSSMTRGALYRHPTTVALTSYAHALVARACIVCLAWPPPPPPVRHRRALGRPPLGRPGPAVRRPLPRRARRLDGRRRAPVDPRRPRPLHLPAAVGRLAATCSATAACCCSAAAPPTSSAAGAC